jgi:1-acyl-sn-glycerol-3-phosphate acyltransferase
MQEPSPAKPTSNVVRERRLVGAVRDLVAELQPRRLQFTDVTLSSRLERDLGIDSLGRTELISRLERVFALRIPAELVSEAETIADLIPALDAAEPDEKLAAEAKAVHAPKLAQVEQPVAAKTLTEALDWHVSEHPGRLHVTVLKDHANVLATMTYEELAGRAKAVALSLIAHDIAPGDRVALMLPTGEEFFVAFFGILYAGATPVPIYPPMQRARIEEHLGRQAGILKNAGASLLITVPVALHVAALLKGLVPTLGAVVSVENLTQNGAAPVPLPKPESSAIGLIQYTSGSTGDPKGVVLTHANLLANIRGFGAAVEATSQDVMVSWLPLYHDMGLIGAWLGTLYYGVPLYVMSPLAFLARPETWLWAMHRYRATLSAAPNFAYELCLRKIRDEDIEGLDLSSVRATLNGAEPVNVQTLRDFIDRFDGYGYRPEAMMPVYGLAENAVGLALPKPGRGPLIDRVDRESLTRHGIAKPAAANDKNAIEFVACGVPIPDHEIRIVDEQRRELGERHEGRLEFRGPSATPGYFRNEARTSAMIRDGWHDSGDRAYMAGGEVHITGRIKDIIIRAGQNIYPQEVEEAVSDISGVRGGGVAVFGAADEAHGTERLVVLAETDLTGNTERDRLHHRIQEVATNILGSPPDDIVLVKRGTVPKTSSGKVRRASARELYLGGNLDQKSRALQVQLARLWLGGLGQRVSRLVRRTGEIFWAGWFYLVVGVALMLGGLSVLVVPGIVRRWKLIRRIAKAVFFLTGVRIKKIGFEKLPPIGAVLAFNHTSYTDALVLTATLPAAPVFVAKRELTKQWIAGKILPRLGMLFVERGSHGKSRSEIDAVTAVAKKGRFIVFFPEGTFTRRAGLTKFYLGAFNVAANAGIPVHPAALRGTRSLLRPDQWFPRRTDIEVEIGDPIRAANAEFESILDLREATRAEVLRMSGEPDLGDIAMPSAQIGI